MKRIFLLSLFALSLIPAAAAARTTEPIDHQVISAPAPHAELAAIPAMPAISPTTSPASVDLGSQLALERAGAAVISLTRPSGQKGSTMSWSMKFAVRSAEGARKVLSAENLNHMPSRVKEDIVGAVERALRSLPADKVLLVETSGHHDTGYLASHGYAQANETTNIQTIDLV